MQKSPCVICSDRNVSCHSTCEKYKNWLSELKKERAKISKLKYLDKTLDSLCRD